MEKLPCLKRANHFWAVLSAIVFSVDGTNVSGGLCSFGALTELVKKKVSEMLIFLNLTLRSFGPENFVPLVQIGKFQKSLIERNESYKLVYYILVGKKSSKTKTARTYAPTQYIIFTVLHGRIHYICIYIISV
jgi:hypothetical protein